MWLLSAASQAADAGLNAIDPFCGEYGRSSFLLHEAILLAGRIPLPFSRQLRIGPGFVDDCYLFVQRVKLPILSSLIAQKDAIAFPNT